MIITGMAHFQSVCKKKLVEWYNAQNENEKIDLSNVFVVWSCKIGTTRMVLPIHR